MAIAVARMGIALDRSVRGDWHRSGIALTAVGGEVDLHQRRTAHDDVRNSDGLSSVEASTEIRMQRCGRTDEADDRVRIRIDRSARDVLIPEIVDRKRDEPIQTGANAQG